MFPRRSALLIAALSTALLSACSAIRYQPLPTISKITPDQGYRLETAQKNRRQDDTFIVLMFSGGGTRAAALGYGVLEQLNQQKVTISGEEKSLLENVDLVVGVSGGSVLATYFSLQGSQTIPLFYKRFLRQNFQKQVLKQAFSLANIPRLTSPEFGRGDLLQEQFELYLFGKATFEDLEKRRKGPFAIITATDMGLGERLNFTQEYFDPMCLNLSKLRLARAVAASSAVPMIFSPITLNNHGGNCNYTLPQRMQAAMAQGNTQQQNKTRQELGNNIKQYSDSSKRPYIHLLDGGLTDNLGMRSLLDMNDLYSGNMLVQQMANRKIRRIVVISVNAQNRESRTLDETAAVPGLRDVVNAVIDIPIAKYSQESLRRFREFTDRWNADGYKGPDGQPISLSFVSLNLKDLPDPAFRQKVLNIPTSFYLPPQDVDDLRHAAAELMKHSQEYRRLLQTLSARPNEEILLAPLEKVSEDDLKSLPPATLPDAEEFNAVNQMPDETFSIQP
ncbi:patatin-like phospholipase family protein [Neisseria sp. ZJ106]|uniref:Patatin-like phospholipase family protein n=1 Tax=Neisseria lisongii TaxID=2912188 RepID=A0ABY7RPK7_9NEIS|nr:patatin-like phospholipase family protein [Neisseria lisongii]MCF7521810.1 patatin-like phospholipase family protein [Neisseria lisongii]WCL72185.1 patatin-like phospholipase family protein [Neisseria lisongii]